MPRSGTPPRHEGGYALLAAVTAMAAFAYIAFQVLAVGQGSIAIVASRVEQAKLAADAEAGINLALHGLAIGDPSERWSYTGRPRTVDFDGARLTIVVEDERSKAPLAGLNDEQARILFQGAGAAGPQLDALVTEFRAWQTQDTTVHTDLEAPETPTGPPMRHGPFATVGELAALPDMDTALFNRIAPVVTVFFGESGPFEAREAQPLAVAAMTAQVGTSPQSLGAQSGAMAQASNEEINDVDDHLVGRALTIWVTAQADDGAHTHRMAIVELTGDKNKPYWVRYVE